MKGMLFSANEGRLRRVFFLGCWLALACRGMGQTAPTVNEVDLFSLRATYSGVLAAGDLADRFGPGFMAGGQLEWWSWPGNWLAGIDFQYGFAGKVKENVLAFLEDPNGEIVGRDLALSRAFLQQRIWTGSVYGGVVIPLVAANRRSGLRLTAGAGYMRHKVRVNDEMKSLPQVEGRYAAGYDRLTGGWALTQFVGYQHLSLNRRLHLMAGIDLIEGFTRSQRSYDFQTMRGDRSSRMDLTIGLRAGIAIALHTGEQADDIYY